MREQFDADINKTLNATSPAKERKREEERLEGERYSAFTRAMPSTIRLSRVINLIPRSVMRALRYRECNTSIQIIIRVPCVETDTRERLGSTSNFSANTREILSI